MESESRKQKIFTCLRSRQDAAGIDSSDSNALICPLCWQETQFPELRIEHAIPGTLGGRTLTLTCKTCNHTHGSTLDSQVAQFKRAHDAAQGLEYFSGKLHVLGHQVTANFGFGQHKTGSEIRIIGKASNPSEAAAIKELMQNRQVSEINLTWNYGYSPNRFRTGLLRSAYLLLFQRYGYAYTLNGIIQTLRNRILDPTLAEPNLRSLVGELRTDGLKVENDYFLISGQFDSDVPFLMVVLRLKRKTTSWYFVITPVPSERDGEFFELAARVAEERPQFEIQVPPEAILL